MVNVRRSNAPNKPCVIEMDRLSEAWKDALLDKAVFTGAEFLALPEAHREWMKKHPHVFTIIDAESDCFYNLLHYENREKLNALKKVNK